MSIYSPRIPEALSGIPWEEHLDLAILVGERGLQGGWGWEGVDWLASKRGNDGRGPSERFKARSAPY